MLVKRAFSNGFPPYTPVKSPFSDMKKIITGVKPTGASMHLGNLV